MNSPKNFRVDSFVAALAMKAPCRVVTNANLTLNGEQTVNSVAVVAGDRVLVKDQTDPIENGIYDVETSDWSRSQDWDGSRDATRGTIVIVASAPLTQYWLDVTGDFVPGTDAATFTLLVL